ncbi:MAG: hypothetical protein HFJ84_11180 [Clostridiales bacterium]|nr:hypothetical protein [Clostridiales bacterium]
MILFIGTQAAGYFVSDVAAAYKETVTYTGAFSFLEEAGDAALETLYDFIIINVEELPGSHEEIADLLFRIHQSTKSTLVVMARNYSPQSELIQNIQKVGISHLLTACSLSGIKEQLERILSMDSAPASPSVPQTPTTECPVFSVSPSNRRFQTIAVAGANPRMGTTTQVLQMVKYLLFRGRKACYLQMNGSNFIGDLKRTYEISSEDPAIGKVTYQNVDLFENPDKISQAFQFGYDFYVYDYGVISSPSFHRVSFLEKDRKFLVCGISPEELPHTNQAISEFYDSDVQYLFNLVPVQDQKSILEMMENQASRTYFPGYAPDPFVYSSSSNVMYRKIFGNETDTRKEPKKKIEKSKWKRR